MVYSHRQTSVSAPDHDRYEYEFAQLVPRTAERVCFIRQANGDANASVATNNLEDDIENGEHRWIGFELAAFNDHDKENGQRDPPRVMCQLAAKLVPHKIGATLALWRRSHVGESALHTPERVTAHHRSRLLSVVIVV